MGTVYHISPSLIVPITILLYSSRNKVGLFTTKQYNKHFSSEARRLRCWPSLNIETGVIRIEMQFYCHSVRGRYEILLRLGNFHGILPFHATSLAISNRIDNGSISRCFCSRQVDHERVIYQNGESVGGKLTSTRY